MYDSHVDNDAFTLFVYLNEKNITDHLQIVEEDGIQVLQGNNFIYITPTSTCSDNSAVRLSDVLLILGHIRILAAKYDVVLNSSDSKKQKSLGFSIEMVFLDNFRHHVFFTDFKSDFESIHGNTKWFEFCLPDDCNLLVGACGSEDFSY